MKKFGTGIRGRQSALPAPRHLPLVDILVDAQAELQELVVASGMKVLAAALTPLYVKTRVQAAWMSSWRARKSVMTRW